MATTQELEIMQLIANAGESKTKAFEALAAVKTQDFDRARNLLAESKAIDVAAHTGPDARTRKSAHGPRARSLHDQPTGTRFDRNVD